MLNLLKSIECRRGKESKNGNTNHQLDHQHHHNYQHIDVILGDVPPTDDVGPVIKMAKNRQQQQQQHKQHHQHVPATISRTQINQKISNKVKLWNSFRMNEGIC